MLIYNYDKETKEFVNESIAPIDHLETIVQGKDMYLIPAHATTIKPPETKENQVAVFNGKDWDVIEDFRGAIVYDKETRAEVKWEQIGALPENLTLKLTKSFNEEYTKAINLVKTQHKACLNKLIHFDEIDLDFKYSSLENITKQIENNIVFSRDDNNKIYTLTKAELTKVQEFLTVYGQLAYIYKWEQEAKISKCSTLAKVEDIMNSMKIEVNTALVKDLVALTATKRKNYFNRLIEDFNN